MKFNYATGKTPDGYECDWCHATGVKLWRPYQLTATHVTLRCLACAQQEQADVIRESKKVLGEAVYKALYTDQIGHLVPAVPTEEGNGFWGYTSVPTPGVWWWHRLPPEIASVTNALARGAR